MTTEGEYTVSLSAGIPRTIAAVHARLAIRDVPAMFGQHLDQVYEAARQGAVRLDGQNIFIYRDAADWPNEADVAFGVGVLEPFERVGNVQPTSTPAGLIASTTHRGTYSGLVAAHRAVKDWCRTLGRSLAGPRWEVYGHWTDDEAQLQTDVVYLLDDNGRER